MGIVTISLHNKAFQLACADGSEKELVALGKEIESKISEIKKTSPTASPELLLLMLALKLEDHINSLELSLSKYETNVEDNESEEFAEVLSSIASHLENIAQKLNKHR